MNYFIHIVFFLVFRKSTCSDNTGLFLSGEVYKKDPDQLSVFKGGTCADPEGGKGVLTPTPEKSQSHRVSLQYWPRSPEKSQSYQASI